MKKIVLVVFGALMLLMLSACDFEEGLNNLLIEQPLAAPREVITFETAYSFAQTGFESLREFHIFNSTPLNRQAEWFMTNRHPVLQVLNDTLVHINSPFADQIFSMFRVRIVDLSDTHTPSAFSVFRANVSIDLITNESLLFLIYSVRGISPHLIIELNLDNGNQLFIRGYSIILIEQKNDSIDQAQLWRAILSINVSPFDNVINWRGFVEDDYGNVNIEVLDGNPFEQD